jgi:hypothetical protein
MFLVSRFHVQCSMFKGSMFKDVRPFCPLSIVHYPLSIIHYPLSIIHYPLSIVHYPLSISPPRGSQRGVMFSCCKAAN